MEETEKKTNKIGLGFILAWGLGGLFVSAGIIELFTKPVIGVFSLLAGLVIFPPAVKFLKSKTNFELSRVLKIILFIVLLGVGGSLSGTTNAKNQSSTNTNNQQSQEQSTVTPTPAVRQVKGTLTTLGAGTFTGGKDVPAGLYDVTTASGESGNFYVTGADSYNEILGQNGIDGVAKIRTKISDGDKIEISGLSTVTFTPVTTPFVSTESLVTLYSGTFTVGEDIAAGRYIATTTAGSSGNFMVDGNNSVNEILGKNEIDGVPSVTTNLSNGDIITISGLDSVTMTPSK